MSRDRTPSLSPAGAAEPSRRSLHPELERKLGRSRVAILLERLWPRLWLPVAVALVFVLVSIGGLWTLLPPRGHLAALAGFAIAGLASLIPLARVRWPSREDGLRRLEHDADVPHRPASSYEDTLSASGVNADAPEARLWAAHRQRLSRLIGRLRVSAPLPRVEHHDPLALRLLLVLATVAAVAFAGDAFRDRLSAAFRTDGTATGATVRLDAWLTPPPYTGRQAVLLLDGAAAKTTEAGEAARALEVPEGTQITIRAAGSGHEAFAASLASGDAAARPLARTVQAKDTSVGVSEFKAQLAGAATIKLTEQGRERYSWQIAVTDDTPPEIKLTKPPGASARGALTLNYRVTDDYGVLSAEARVALAEPQAGKTLKLADGSELGSFGEPPVIPLKLPRAGKGSKAVEGRSTGDLAAHPWAGLKVRLTLAAKDQAGQQGTQVTEPILLPARNFRNPLAKALVEQRRKLAFAPGRFREVRQALDALAIAPEIFSIEPSVYLGIRTAYFRLGQPPSRDGFQSVIDQLWEIALNLEDGALSDAERRMKEAQDRLAQAIEEGASPEELQRLMQELKQAMNEFLRELAEQARQNPQAGDQQAPNQQMMTQRDLQKMLEDIEKLAQSGSREQAQQMLSELRDMLDRLQAGQPGQSAQSRQMQQMMDEFGNLITKQRQLLDDTFGAQRGQQPGENGEQGQQGQQGEQGEGQSGSGLARRQGELRDQLGRLMEQLRGMGQNGEGLDDAGRAMQGAEESLGQQDLGTASEQQSQALDELRRSAREMTEQMMTGQQGGTGSRAGGNDDRDPLNRRTNDPDLGSPGFSTAVPKEIDVQRARQILEELRRRLGDSTRSDKELDYIERLLKQN